GRRYEAAGGVDTDVVVVSLFPGGLTWVARCQCSPSSTSPSRLSSDDAACPAGAVGDTGAGRAYVRRWRSKTAEGMEPLVGLLHVYPCRVAGCPNCSAAPHAKWLARRAWTGSRYG